MKNILVVLFLFFIHFSFAQKLVGIYNSNNRMGLFMFTPSSNSIKLCKMPSLLGKPNLFSPSICQYGSEIYGRIGIDDIIGNGSIYKYDPATNTFGCLYLFELAPINSNRNELLVSKAGLLYGIASDSLAGAYVFEFDPYTKVFKRYYTDENINIINAHYVTIAENDKMYFIVESANTDNKAISKIVEFDLSTKLFVEKLATKEIACEAHLASDVMTDVGNGQLGGAVNISGRALSIFLYNYITNEVTSYTFDKKLYDRSAGPLIRYGADLYIMTSSGKRNGFGSVLKINMTTGNYEEVANFSALNIYHPATGCVLNDVLYGYEVGDKIISYDFKNQKVSVVRFLKEDGFDANSGFILAK